MNWDFLPPLQTDILLLNERYKIKRATINGSAVVWCQQKSTMGARSWRQLITVMTIITRSINFVVQQCRINRTLLIRPPFFFSLNHYD